MRGPKTPSFIRPDQSARAERENRAGMPFSALPVSLETVKISFFQVWITVKDPEFWSPIKKDNVRFIHEMVNELVSQGVFVGIQTSQSHWDAVTGGTTAFKDLLLWHVQLDNKPNFDGFEPFGGWKTPAIKQYSDPVVICGVGVNKNWDPLEESIWRLSPAVWSRIPM